MKARRAAVAAALLLVSAPLAAQTSQVGAGILFQRFTFDDVGAASVESISLRAIPFAGTVRFGARTTFAVSGTWAEGRLEDPERGTLTIDGLTDTQVALTVAGRGGATSVSALVLLPTGNEAQTLDEARVAGAVASELLPFAISNWGTGGGGGVSASTAHVVGNLGVGLSASYVVRRAFEPLAEETFSYRPGNVLRLVAAVDGTIGEGGKGTLRFSYFHHEKDSAEEQNLFKAGNRLELMGSLGFPVGTHATGLVYALFHRRDQGTYLSADGSLASQDLVLAGAGLRRRVGGVVLQPRLEGRVFRREDGIEQGYTVGAGLDAEITTGQATWVPSVRAHTGNLEIREGVETGFTGLELGLALRFGGSR